MRATDVIRRLHRHRMWANDKLLAAAEELDDAQLQRPFPIGQGSLWRTLTHLYAAEFVWLAALKGDASPLTPGDSPEGLPGNQRAEGAATSLAELRERWEELNSRWNQYLTNLDETLLSELVGKVSAGSQTGEKRFTTCCDVLLHVCTHAQYTTAQAVSMLRGLGAARLPDVMLITLARSE